MSRTHAAQEPPAEERWVALGSVLLSTLYLWVIGWLLVFTVVPAIGLGWTPVVITSGSMEPLIRAGDVVLTSDLPADVTLEPGAVITFEDPARPGQLITHRVVEASPDGTYRTRGDANRDADSSPVPADTVVGVGRLLVPLIGLPLLWLSTGLLLFTLWLGVTVAAAAVAFQNGAEDEREPREARAPRTLRPVALLRALQPRQVQQRLTVVARRRVGVLMGWVAPSALPVAGAARRWAPTLAIALVAAIAAVLGTAATVAVPLAGTALTVALLFDPRGPELRVGRWRRNTVRVAHTVATALPMALLGRGFIAFVGIGLLTTSTVGRSVASFSSASPNAGSSFAAAATFPGAAPTTYWLQTSPEGQDTTSQARLPFATTAPTQTTLYNYDTDRDTAAGLLIKRKGVGPAEADPTKVQRWTRTITTDTTFSSARVVFHAATKSFTSGKAGIIHWYLLDCAAGGTSCVRVDTATVSRADWQAGSAGWVEATADFGAQSYTFGAGRELHLVTTVDNDSGDEYWFAYGTDGQPSRLELGTASGGVCPGATTVNVPVAVDTYVDQGAPTSSFVNANDVLVRSTAGGNARTLLTFAMPAIPAGCSITSATLQMYTVTSSLGRTYQVVRTDTAFDPTTVTWATQPAASGSFGTGLSTVNGPTLFDATTPVRELYSIGNTGLLVRDAVESDGGTSSNKYASLEGTSDTTRHPQLIVEWG